MPSFDTLARSRRTPRDAALGSALTAAFLTLARHCAEVGALFAEAGLALAPGLGLRGAEPTLWMQDEESL